ncbi:hypothetical protein LCGC14_2434010 [marine sediment metagenome]|uniref:Uncharacterized protein n=1 Tax=marine sediment metagenome TaxID=412755 RepID=A0A0F9C8E2_9ZZZZ
MPTLDILDGFCFDHGHHLGFACPKCTKAKAQRSARSIDRAGEHEKPVNRERAVAPEYPETVERAERCEQPELQERPS